MTIFFDIEARPCADMGECDRDFPPPPFHWVTTIGTCEIRPDGGAQFDAFRGDEREVLGSFAEMMGRARRLVSWNGRGYDLPVIQARAMRHGVLLPRFGVWMHRFRDDHVDLMDVLCGHGAAARGRLADYARVIGLPGKHVGDGFKVGEMTPEEEAAYCLDDVAQLALVYCAWKVTTGADVDAVRGSIVGAIHADHRLRPLSAALLDAKQEAAQ